MTLCKSLNLSELSDLICKIKGSDQMFSENLLAPVLLVLCSCAEAQAVQVPGFSCLFLPEAKASSDSGPRILAPSRGHWLTIFSSLVPLSPHFTFSLSFFSLSLSLSPSLSPPFPSLPPHFSSSSLSLAKISRKPSSCLYIVWRDLPEHTTEMQKHF